MTGMSKPKVVNQLQLHRLARYVKQYPREVRLFAYHSAPCGLYVYADTDWAADELTRCSKSCTVERYGDHVLGCSVAK